MSFQNTTNSRELKKASKNTNHPSSIPFVYKQAILRYITLFLKTLHLIYCERTRELQTSLDKSMTIEITAGHNVT